MIITQVGYFDRANSLPGDEKRMDLSRLRPWAPLWRLWPVRLTAVTTQLRYCHRAITGRHLLEKYFPQALKEYGDLGQSTWWDILLDLGHRVEQAGWFELEWEVLNEAWTEWLENPGDSGDALAIFLTSIPIRLYGFNREPAAIGLFNAEPGLYLEFFPPGELLYVLLDPSAAATSSGLLVGAGLYDKWDNWNESSRAAAWARLRAIEVAPEAYPESVRWLPALARWACGTSGNPILDWSFSSYYEWNERRFSWQADVEKAMMAWQEAQPVIAQFDRLLKWCQERADNLVSLAEFLTEGKNVERLDWSQVAPDETETGEIPQLNEGQL